MLGRVSASHRITSTLGSPVEVSLKSKIFVTITFKAPVVFDTMILGVSTLVDYLGLMAGRTQNIVEIEISTGLEDEKPTGLEIYWCMPPHRTSSHEENRPHPAEVLINGGFEPGEFSNVLTRWLERQPEWSDARWRFSNSFGKQQSYDIERLISSANMFDILPISAIKPEEPISEELKQATTHCQLIFKKLPLSPERDSVLGILGRVGKSNLKSKIRDRAQIVMDRVGEKLPELFKVTDEAVNCRNHYVHGSETKVDYEKNLDIVSFLTDTLEFVFAASDLIEAGWDIETWWSRGTTMSHPFGSFRVGYANNLQRLIALLNK